MVDFEITKTKKLLEINNSMCHNYYFIVYGRIYNKEKTKMRKFKYVEWFDIFDIMEFFEIDIVTKEDIREYLNNLENTYLLNIKNFNDKKGLKEFYNYCNETIHNYNEIAKFY